MGYFKGWYFKCCNESETVAFIPAYHIMEGKRTASLQIITDDGAYNIPFESLVYTEKPLTVKIGNCRFSEKEIELNYRSDELNISGVLRFGPVMPIKYDIMGPFALIPFMQCRHSVFSMSHRVDGQIILNGRQYDFENGTGYIEGDSGRSFPKQYIWTECNFENGSLMLSVADIPLLGLHFTGIIGIIMINGREMRLATYLGARLSEIGEDKVTVSQGAYRLTAKLWKKNPHPLNAPVNGGMIRTIHESASCTAYYCFSYGEEIIFEFTSRRAAFEFEYLWKK